MLKMVIYFLLCFWVVRGYAVEFTIFHINDVHGRIESNTSDIGYAKMATVINQAKKEGKNVLFIDAGDSFHGSVLANLSKGEIVLDILNQMKLDAMVLGNHDYNYGFKRDLEIQKKAKFKILVANVVDKEGKLPFQANMIKEIGGIKVGLFGLSTPETMYKTHPNNVKEIKFLDPLKVAKEQVEILKKQGATFIIAIAHLGLDSSTKVEERSSALAKVKGLNLVIDGHSHTALAQGKKVKDIVIVQTGSHSANLGKIVIDIDDKSTNIQAELVSSRDLAKTKEDSNIVKIVKQYKDIQDKTMEKIVATLPWDLDGTREKVRAEETNLGDIVADSYKYASGADVALVNGGEIRDSFKKGKISYIDVLKVLPFQNVMMMIEVSGEKLKQALEKSVSSLPDNSGGFLQVSGLTFNVNSKAQVGKRVSEIKINDQNIDMQKAYKVVLSDFIAVGGDGYEMFKNTKILASFNTGDAMFIKYLKEQKLDNYRFGNRINIK